jgi:chromosome segregation ATPase
MIREQVITMKEQISEAGQLVGGVKDNLGQIDTNSMEMEAQLGRFNVDKEATQKELSVGIHYVQTQGEQHLTSAEEAANRYGEKSAKLSELAEEAKQLSDKQEQRRREIFAMAEQVSYF